MAIVAVKSGLVQRVEPQTRNELHVNRATGEAAKGSDIFTSVKDPASQFAIPDVPTSEAPYDGFVCFGTFISDIDLSG